ncbi:MAG: FAD:protein FMN transferase [Pedosphaera sp.]|nr:FAD:protein FMN transferase [Pedosphaera sp.]
MPPLFHITRIWRQVRVFCLLLVAGCATARNDGPFARFEFAQPAMGTIFRITLHAPDEKRAEAAAKAAFARVIELELAMTDYDPESELLRLCRPPHGQPVQVSRDLFTALQHARVLAELTEGAIDPTVGPYVQLWRRARRQRELPAPEKLAEAAAAVGWRKFQLDTKKQTVTLLAPNMRLDLGGVAKGYAADAALAVLRSHDIRRALVAASGDLAIGDPPPGKTGWAIGLTSFVSDKPDRQAVLRNCGVSTSGDTEQFLLLDGTRYSHIVNPLTGRALTNRISANIIAPTATASDILATAVCVLGAEKSLEMVKTLDGVHFRAVTLRDGKPAEVASAGFPSPAKSEK